MLPSSSPLLIILSSPSGAGKSTLCKMLVERNKNIKLSISSTTRKARTSEIDGKHYSFISSEEFKKMVEEDKFIEYAEVFENLYGTPKEMVEKEINSGNSVLFDIDWQGARQIIKKFNKERIISFFILPPSIEELHRRLQIRAEDGEEVVLRRMQKAKDEMSHFDEYDYVLINENLEQTYQKILGFISNHQEKQVTNKQEIRSFVAKLIQ